MINCGKNDADVAVVAGLSVITVKKKMWNGQSTGFSSAFSRWDWIDIAWA
ncbi:hypothetical protein SynMEDNS5_01251 [Synechococcus sp. MEDNS5]|nr:hypothetical protein SynMEDNS5_01251 [Synechococcus sp. MEDNS5]